MRRRSLAELQPGRTNTTRCCRVHAVRHTTSAHTIATVHTRATVHTCASAYQCHCAHQRHRAPVPLCHTRWAVAVTSSGTRSSPSRPTARPAPATAPATARAAAPATYLDVLQPATACTRPVALCTRGRGVASSGAARSLVAAAATTYCTWLQPIRHLVAASTTYGCSPTYLLQYSYAYTCTTVAGKPDPTAKTWCMVWSEVPLYAYAYRVCMRLAASTRCSEAKAYCQLVVARLQRGCPRETQGRRLHRRWFVCRGAGRPG